MFENFKKKLEFRKLRNEVAKTGVLSNYNTQKKVIDPFKRRYKPRETYYLQLDSDIISRIAKSNSLYFDDFIINNIIDSAGITLEKYILPSCESVKNAAIAFKGENVVKYVLSDLVSAIKNVKDAYIILSNKKVDTLPKQCILNTIADQELKGVYLHYVFNDFIHQKNKFKDLDNFYRKLDEYNPNKELFEREKVITYILNSENINFAINNVTKIIEDLRYSFNIKKPGAIYNHKKLDINTLKIRLDETIDSILKLKESKSRNLHNLCN